MYAVISSLVLNHKSIKNTGSKHLWNRSCYTGGKRMYCFV